MTTTRRTSSRSLVVVVAAGSLLAGCGGPVPEKGDPGISRLKALAGLAIFDSLPPGAQRTGALALSPASYTKPVFDGGGWDGPSVTETFTSASDPGSVFAFFRTATAHQGWVSNGNINALGYPEVWNQHLAGGFTATLTITDMDLRSAVRGQTSTYTLSASTPEIS